MRRLICFLIILLILFPAIGCYAHGPWRGKVIEADTKKPIEGAVVVGVWYDVKRLWRLGGSRKPIKVVETVTNADGEFYISSKYFVDLGDMIRSVTGPDFLIYKPGYAVSGDAPQALGKANSPPLDKKELAVIELPRLESKKDREKARKAADDFRFSINVYDPTKTNTPTLDEFLKYRLQ